MSVVGPTIREVPVSMMAWQPPEQATVWPLMITLGKATIEGGFYNLHLIRWSTPFTVSHWFWIHFWAPVHFDLPVGGRGQRDPRDLPCVVAVINTSKDHLTALLAVSERETEREQRSNNKLILCKMNHHPQPTDVHPVSVPAQVDGEHVICHETLLDHIVKDGHDIIRGNALESQAQDAISLHAGHEGSLCLAKSKHLVGYSEAAHLDTWDSCQSQSEQAVEVLYARLKSKYTVHFVPGPLPTSTVSLPRYPVMLPVPYWMEMGWLPCWKEEDCCGLNFSWFSAKEQLSLSPRQASWMFSR